MPSPPTGQSSRRSVLRTVGVSAVIATAGCLGDSAGTTDAPPTTTETTTNATTTTTRLPNEPVTAVAVTQSFAHRFASAHTRAVTAPDDLFVFATLATADLDPESVRLTVGDETYLPADELHGADVSSTNRSRESDRPVIAFSLPNERTDRNATIHVGDSVAQRLPAPAQRRIADPPALRFEAATIASVDDSGEHARVEIAAENRGGADDRFRATVGAASLSGRPVQSIAVPAGESVVETVSVPLFGADATVVVDWTTDRRELSVSG